MDSNQINGQMQNDPNSNNVEGSQSAYEAAYGASQYNQPQHVQPSQPPVAGTEVFQSQPSGYQTQPQTQPQGQYQQYAAPQPSYQAAPQPSTQAAPQSIPGSAPQATSQVVTPVAANPSPQKRSGAKTFLLAFAGAAVACVVAFGLFMGFRPFDSGNGVNVTLGGSGSSVEAVEAEASLAEAVANKCLPSVVSINTYSTGSSGSSNPLYDYFYGGSQDSGEETMSGLGSGIIISTDGYILTNYHVIANATRFEVNIEGDIHEATLVGQDASSDIAVLKVDEATDLTPIEIADSDNVRIGEWVMTIGSPFGLEQSVATGIISATSRSQIMDSSTIDPSGSIGQTIYPNLIQTDAAINPGNSGGALVDADGQLVGVNTLISSYSGNYSGVGFAIPSNYAVSIAQDIIAGKEPTHAQLGVTTANVTSQIAQRYGLSVTSGAYVTNVTEGGAAANAGIEVGDVIISFDGKEVSSSSDLVLDVRTKAPGDKVTIVVSRNGEDVELEATLGESSSASTQQNNQQQQQPQQQLPDLNDLFGYGQR